MSEPGRYTVFPAELAVLVGLCERAPGRRAIEIGAYDGRTSEALARACARVHKRFMAIDPWAGTQDAADEAVYERFVQRMRPFGSAIDVVRARSHDVTPPENVGFVFHDGDHRDPDFARWYAALVPGGVLAVHDVDDPGWPAIAAAVAALDTRQRFTFRYTPTPAERAVYGPGVRGLAWFVKC